MLGVTYIEIICVGDYSFRLSGSGSEFATLSRQRFRAKYLRTCAKAFCNLCESNFNVALNVPYSRRFHNSARLIIWADRLLGRGE